MLAMNEDDLLSVRNFGRKSLDELYDRLRVRGLMDKEHTPAAAAGTGE
ncbi:MAG TPA: DNA-directed RNA polymerase subunit alpha C-terminal domain-containing protein [Chloroflexota bacterium]